MPNPTMSQFSSEEDHKFDDFSGRSLLLFPGQGAQYIGMGVVCAGACKKSMGLYDSASKMLGYDLLEKCKNGPKSELDKTEVCQIATFVHSMAVIEAEKEKDNSIFQDITVAMGLSLGEYSALCFAGAISFEDGLRICMERGSAMQNAAEKTSTGMVSVIGLTIPEVERMLVEVREQTREEIIIANYLCDKTYVVSGSKACCSLVEQIANPKYNARMTIPLAVAGAFHTSYMDSAISRLDTILDDVVINEPRIPVVSNVDGRPHSDPKVIRQLLKKQVVSPVQWESSMQSVLKAGYEKAHEVGPGTVLKGLLTRMDPSKAKTVQCHS